jgi:hypothetical protein
MNVLSARRIDSVEEARAWFAELADVGGNVPHPDDSAAVNGRIDIVGPLFDRATIEDAEAYDLTMARVRVVFAEAGLDIYREALRAERRRIRPGGWVHLCQTCWERWNDSEYLPSHSVGSDDCDQCGDIALLYATR